MKLSIENKSKKTFLYKDWFMLSGDSALHRACVIDYMVSVVGKPKEFLIRSVNNPEILTDDDKAKINKIAQLELIYKYD